VSSSNYQSIWKVAEEDRVKTTQWAQILGVPRMIAHLLTLRRIETIESAERFLNPCLENICDPFLLKDMHPAVDRIRRARECGGHVLVFGDYDVDGIAGTAILVNALRDFGIARCSYGLPSRFLEGYGLSSDRVEAAHEQGVDLIVTVDNGIGAREAAETAKRLDIGLIVTDHHQLEGDLPEAAAIINPAIEDPPGPCAHASGAAVAFKLAWALTGKREGLDIVALGTVADAVPLRGENRDLVAAGLEHMRRCPRLGLQALASVARVRLDEITTEDIAFQLAPRINAAGRLKDGKLALELLLADSPGDAARMAGELNRANEERRDIERAILEEALEELDATFHAEQHSIVLAHRHWHPGVVGIVASQILSRYNCPVVLIAVNKDGLGRGSARSTPEFDMLGALSACAGSLERFGGHLTAAGITILEQNIEAFKEAFEVEAARRVPKREPRKMLEVDALVSLSEIDVRLVRTLERLQPFGHANHAPVFCSYGVQPLPDSVRELQGRHLRFDVRQGARVLNVIGFRMAGRLTPARAVAPIDIAYTPQLNTWRGETSIQLALRDIHSAPL